MADCKSIMHLHTHCAHLNTRYIGLRTLFLFSFYSKQLYATQRAESLLNQPPNRRRDSLFAASRMEKMMNKRRSKVEERRRMSMRGQQTGVAGLMLVCIYGWMQLTRRCRVNYYTFKHTACYGHNIRYFILYLYTESEPFFVRKEKIMQQLFSKPFQWIQLNSTLKRLR